MDHLSEGFDMHTGRNMGRGQNGAAKLLQQLGPKEKGDCGQLYAHNPHLKEQKSHKQRTPTTI